VPQHPTALTRPQRVGVVYAFATGDQRRDQGHRLVTDVGPAWSRAEVDVVVEHVAQPEVLGERGREQEPGIGDRVVVIELN